MAESDGKSRIWQLEEDGAMEATGEVDAGVDGVGGRWS
jgi:hypothetical protein